jgi:polyisoprenoid-binding protein YceI
MKRLTFAVALVLFLSAFVTYSSVSWKIADGYFIKFTSKDPSGVFKSLKGDIDFDQNNLAASKFNVTVDVASINTGNGMKNKQALNDSWFDVAKYPTIKFVSGKIEKTASGYQATGMLEIHGTTKQVTIPFTFSNNTFVGSFDVNRTDFNVGSTTGMSAHASTILKVDLSVPVTK